MKIEKLIANELQCMFLEGELNGVKEEYVNNITKKLRTGVLSINELIQEDPTLKEKVLEASLRISDLIN